MSDFEYKFQVIFFEKSALGHRLTEAVAEAQKEGFDYHDVRFAQSSASGTGVSSLLVLRRPYEG